MPLRSGAGHAAACPTAWLLVGSSYGSAIQSHLIPSWERQVARQVQFDIESCAHHAQKLVDTRLCVAMLPCLSGRTRQGLEDGRRVKRSAPPLHSSCLQP